MAQQVRIRQQPATVKFSANNRAAESMSRGMVYRELALRLQGAPTVTALNNTRNNTLVGDEWNVIQSLEIVANGTDVLKRIDGNALWWLNYFLYGTAPQITPTLGNGVTVNPAFDSVLILPFWMPLSVKPLDTALDSRELSSLEIAITWGDFTSINSAATGWTTEPTVEVYSLESFNVTGPFSQWRIFPIDTTIAATTAELQISLPVGKMYRGFLINTIDGISEQGNILNNFKLVSGTTVFADISAGDDVLQQWTRLRYGISRQYDLGANAYQPFRRATNSSIDGWYFYDHVTDGRLTEAIDTLGFSEFQITANVTVGAGATRIVVYPFEIVPVRGG